MQFNVAQLLRAPLGTSRHYTVDEPASALQAALDGDGVAVQGPVQGAVAFMHTTDGILVTGTLETVLELACDRCLDPLLVPVTIELEESFRPTIDLGSGAMLPRVAGEESATLIDEQHILDLLEVVRQGTLVATPMHQLCRPDCAGLCPQCGQNLNEGPCSCEAEVVDPRWLKLKALLDEATELDRRL